MEDAQREKQADGGSGERKNYAIENIMEEHLH